MNESDWLCSTDPSIMLEFLAGSISLRKLRLFACACCRRIGALLPDERTQGVVELAEKYADGEVTPEQIAAGRTRAFERQTELQREEWKVEAEVEFDPEAPAYRQVLAHLSAGEAACAVSNENLSEGVEEFLTSIHMAVYYAFLPGPETEEAGLRAALRTSIDPRITAVEAARRARSQVRGELAVTAADVELAAQTAILRDLIRNPFRAVRPWRAGSSIAVDLARSIYTDRAFDRLPILADALEEAGCTDAEILDHCRQPGEHVRGCWVVDLLLGKE